ncbi:MAG: RNA methyltransferase substrate-binding domain-containing protein, partial [Alphaproteobacteria bacterium]
MSRRKPEPRKPARSAPAGGSNPSNSRDKRPNHPGGKSAGHPGGKSGKPAGKARPYGSQGKPGRGESRPDPRRDDRREDRQEQRRSDFVPQRRPESASRPPRDDGFRERDHAERHGNRSHGGDKFSPRHRDHRGDLPVWLYGIHAVLAALENDERLIRRILISRETREALGDRLPRLSAQPETVDRMKLDSLLPPGAVHQGIA